MYIYILLFCLFFRYHKVRLHKQYIYKKKFNKSEKKYTAVLRDTIKGTPCITSILILLMHELPCQFIYPYFNINTSFMSVVCTQLCHRLSPKRFISVYSFFLSFPHFRTPESTNIMHSFFECMCFNAT